MNYFIIILVIILLLFIILIYNCGVYFTKINNISGFWECDTDFNNDAELKSFIIYISPYDIKTNVFASYILMVDYEDKILINTPIDIKFSFNKLNDLFTFNIDFIDLNSEFLPNKLKCKLENGKFILSDKDTIYGCFYKNNVLSDLQKSEQKTE